MNLSTETKTPEGQAPRKFMFERSFDDASVVHRAPERRPVLMKPEQIDALKKEQYDAGHAAGKKEGRDEQTARLEAVVGKIEHNLSLIVQNFAAMAEEQDKHTRALVVAIARKIMPDFMKKAGLQEIEALLSDTIRDMAREPRLVVRVHEAEFDAVNARVQEIATKRAYSGKVIVLADADIAAGDCRIEWADGGVERKAQATLEATEQTIMPTQQ